MRWQASAGKRDRDGEENRLLLPGWITAERAGNIAKAVA